MPRLFTNFLDHILNHFVVFLIVDLESETVTLLHYSSSQKCCFFPNTSREDQRINLALQLDVIATNEAEDAVNDNVKGQPTFRI